MNGKHIMFQKMSQLMDNDIATEEEKNSILDHIQSCDQCRREYARLQEMMKLFAGIRKNDRLRADLSGSVVKEYLSRKRKKSFFKIMPAVAAAVVFILAFGLNSYWQGGRHTSRIASSSLSVAPANDTSKVVDIISRNNAKILKVTDLYIEGEVSGGSFKRLRKELGFRRFRMHLYGEKAGLRRILLKKSGLSPIKRIWMPKRMEIPREQSGSGYIKNNYSAFHYRFYFEAELSNSSVLIIKPPHTPLELYSEDICASSS